MFSKGSVISEISTLFFSPK